MSNRSIPPPQITLGREMVLDFIGDTMVTLHTSNPPSDADWKIYLDSLRGRDLEALRSIVLTDGGAPGSKQRKELNDVLRGVHVRGIVISPSMAVRGVVTALSWFNPRIKAFAPTEFDEGLRYLGVTPDEEPEIWLMIDDLRAELSEPNLRAIPERRRTSRS